MKSANNVSSSSEMKRLYLTEVVTHCIREKGISGTSMSDICHRSNMSPGNIYRYFNGKMDMVHASLKLNFSRQIMLLPDIYAQNNPLDYILKANFIGSNNPLHLIYDVKTVFCIEKMYYKDLARVFNRETHQLLESHLTNIINHNNSINLKEARGMAEIIEFFITDTTMKRNSQKMKDKEMLVFYESLIDAFTCSSIMTCWLKIKRG